MIKLSDIKMKEVINIASGERLGYIYDFEINTEEGIVEAVVLPDNTKGGGFFSKPIDITINWNEIVKVGEDIILVDFPNLD
ncbi:MAG: YlmC/YmxH family sporulation protein [Tissierella sp.]|uniref:YlmC/YmxH family sporulation protein n=1 Tax=Tissierella sp. TaxID=41274 RepID=UPI003F96F3AE